MYPATFRKRKSQSYEVRNLSSIEGVLQAFGLNWTTGGWYLQERFFVFCDFLISGSEDFFFLNWRELIIKCLKMRCYRICYLAEDRDISTENRK